MGIDRHLDPCRHWDRPDPAMFPDQIYNAPAAIPLLDARERQRGHFRPPQPTAEEHGQDGPVPEALGRCGVRRVQQRLGFPDG
jgi:hypothetical protein